MSLQLVGPKNPTRAPPQSSRVFKLTWTRAERQVWNVGVGPLQLDQNHCVQPVLFVGSLGYGPPPTPQINTIVLEVFRGWGAKGGGR